MRQPQSIQVYDVMPLTTTLLIIIQTLNADLVPQTITQVGQRK